MYVCMYAYNSAYSGCVCVCIFNNPIERTGAHAYTSMHTSALTPRVHVLHVYMYVNPFQFFSDICIVGQEK